MSWRQYNRNYQRCSTYIGNPSWLTRNHWLVRRNLWCYKPNQAAAGYTSWNTSKDEAVPCDNKIGKIKVNRDGAKKINQYIKSVRAGGAQMQILGLPLLKIIIYLRIPPLIAIALVKGRM